MILLVSPGDDLQLTMRWLEKQCKAVTSAVVGFEPTPLQRLEPKTSTFDHSATLPDVQLTGYGNDSVQFDAATPLLLSVLSELYQLWKKGFQKYMPYVEN